MLATALRDISFHRFIIEGSKRDRPMFRTEHAVFVVPGLARRAGCEVEYVLRRPCRRRGTSAGKDRATPESDSYHTSHHRWQIPTSFSELLYIRLAN